MSLRFGSMVVGAAAVLASFSFASNDAHACGGCFHGPTPIDQPDQATVVTGHRMALSVSMDHTILWDQIQYAGKPEDFAWVLPVRPGAYLELASDAFFEALDAATATTVRAPQIFCPDNNGGFGGDDYYEGDYSPGCNAFSCGAMAAGEGADGYGGSGGGNAYGGAGGNGVPPDPVKVTHKASIGPYETVTIHSVVPGALYEWLDSHGYVVDDSLQPMINDYESEGFDFIALRLIPGQDVQQMQPVRVVTPGASPVLPLRMVAAGTGPNVAITLFVIGEGRWVTQNFPGGEVTSEDLAWDFASSSSNYSEVRNAALAQQDGRVWLTTFSRQGALTKSLSSPVGGDITYEATNGAMASSIWGLYMTQGYAEDASIDPACANGGPVVLDNPKVVAPCGLTDEPPAGGTGGGGAGGGGGGAGGSECNAEVGPGEIDARQFSCGPLDDMAAALVGLHVNDVWVTRLEASLPHEALSEDLGLQADPSQGEIDNWVSAGSVANPPCADWQYFDNSSGAAAPPAMNQKPPRKSPPGGGQRNELLLLGLALATVGSAVARRLARPALRSARASR